MTPFTEQHLLLDLLRGSPPAIPPSGLDADLFLKLVADHGLAGLIHPRIPSSDPAWPASLSRALKERWRKTLADNLILVEALREVGSLLQDNGLEFIVLKGGSLLGFLYPEIHLRPMADLDLLIRPKDWPAVARLLGARNYRLPSPEEERRDRRHGYCHTVETPPTPTCSIEFHWDLESVGRNRIDRDELFRSAVTCTIEGGSFKRLCDDHLLLHLAMHMAHHFTRPSLHWVEDLRRLLRVGRLDWPRVADLARVWRMENCLAYSLGYLEKLFPASLPEPGRLFRLSPVRSMIMRRLQSPEPLLPHLPMETSPLRFLVTLLLLDRWTDAARYLAVHTVRRLSP
ncbi:MAG: nucleotidyltransferase family protein [Acidobacteriota bacterium]